MDRPNVERMAMLPRLRALLGRLEPLLWVLLLGYAGYRLWPQVAAALAFGAAREEAPAFSVTTLDGEEISLEDLNGQVVLVNFWATWCPPCRVEMPGFERVYQARRDDGFVIVGLSTDRLGAAPVERFLQERGITFPVALAPDLVIDAFGGVRGLPTSFLIDRAGRVRHTVTGIFAEPALRMAVDRLLSEPISTLPLDPTAPTDASDILRDS